MTNEWRFWRMCADFRPISKPAPLFFSSTQFQATFTNNRLLSGNNISGNVPTFSCWLVAATPSVIAFGLLINEAIQLCIHCSFLDVFLCGLFHGWSRYVTYVTWKCSTGCFPSKKTSKKHLRLIQQKIVGFTAMKQLPALSTFPYFRLWVMVELKRTTSCQHSFWKNPNEAASTYLGNGWSCLNISWIPKNPRIAPEGPSQWQLLSSFGLLFARLVHWPWHNLHGKAAWKIHLAGWKMARYGEYCDTKAYLDWH